MSVKVGPAGLGSINEAKETLEAFSKLGLNACEIAFVRNIYIKDKEDAKKIGKIAKDLGISLSIHAPYFINLNSLEKTKIYASKHRILKCLEIGEFLGVKKVVFHAGFYSGMDKEKAYENIKNNILELEEERKQKHFSAKLAVEITGKKNVFGSIEEISRLVKETGISFCIDFAHILARHGNYKFEEVKENFKEFKDWHIHFSGIEYEEKGEKKHIPTQEKEIKKLLENLPKDKNITIISEAPEPIKDAFLIKCLHKG